ncbi:unnamed protein product [Nesidiocoris tenuis]|uniref:Uncharacterized protein n=1 Tax=Nesidiocoris tenuis TaxID=355587 RepID=A0A6H5GR06_9HEMI|nr:unnamed protein product [Nesidiocoris tenuis]
MSAAGEVSVYFCTRALAGLMIHSNVKIIQIIKNLHLSIRFSHRKLVIRFANKEWTVRSSANQRRDKLTNATAQTPSEKIRTSHLPRHDHVAGRHHLGSSELGATLPLRHHTFLSRTVISSTTSVYELSKIACLPNGTAVGSFWGGYVLCFQILLSLEPFLATLIEKQFGVFRNFRASVLDCIFHSRLNRTNAQRFWNRFKPVAGSTVHGPDSEVTGPDMICIGVRSRFKDNCHLMNASRTLHGAYIRALSICVALTHDARKLLVFNFVIRLAGLMLLFNRHIRRSARPRATIEKQLWKWEASWPQVGGHMGQNSNRCPTSHSVEIRRTSKVVKFLTIIVRIILNILNYYPIRYNCRPVSVITPSVLMMVPPRAIKQLCHSPRPPVSNRNSSRYHELVETSRPKYIDDLHIMIDSC